MIRKISQPHQLPAPGGKLIEEHVGRVNTQTTSLSVAHMVAPPGWTEPFQQPQFDEVTIVLRGTMRVEHEGGCVDVQAGETVLVEAGDRIRYANPHDEEAEYWAVCAPAFSPELVGLPCTHKSKSYSGSDRLALTASEHEIEWSSSILRATGPKLLPPAKGARGASASTRNRPLEGAGPPQAALGVEGDGKSANAAISDLCVHGRLVGREDG